MVCVLSVLGLLGLTDNVCVTVVRVRVWLLCSTVSWVCVVGRLVRLGKWVLVVVSLVTVVGMLSRIVRAQVRVSVFEGAVDGVGGVLIRAGLVSVCVKQLVSLVMVSWLVLSCGVVVLNSCRVLLHWCLFVVTRFLTRLSCVVKLGRVVCDWVWLMVVCVVVGLLRVKVILVVAIRLRAACVFMGRVVSCVCLVCS